MTHNGLGSEKFSSLEKWRKKNIFSKDLLKWPHFGAMEKNSFPRSFEAATMSMTDYSNASEWEIALNKRYGEDEIISIMNMVSYLENERRGFDCSNEEEDYREERQADQDNRLYSEAMLGLQLLERGPTTFSGMRALNFVLDNQNMIDKTLLINIRLVRVDFDFAQKKGMNLK
eukprot:gene34199-41398_t